MRKIGILLLTLTFCLASWPLYAVEDLSAYQYYKEVTVAENGFAYINLDAEVLKRTRNDLADIRLSTVEKEEIPYQLTPYSPAQEKYIDAEMIDQMLDGNEYLLTLDMHNSGQLHNKAVLDIDSESDFYCEVQIESSADNKSWNFVARDKIFTVKPEYEKDDISYPASSSRYLRLRISATAGPAIIIKGAEVSFRSAASNTFQELSSSVIAREDDTHDGISRIIIDLGVKGCFVQNIQLQVNARNYQRIVRVYSSNDREGWRELSSAGEVFHFNWSDYEALQNSLSVNGSADRYLKLEINNGSSPPLEVAEVVVNGSFPRLLADMKEGTYLLWYAKQLSLKPVYDLAGFAHLIDKSVLSTISPGLEKINPDYQAPSIPWTERNPWILNLTVITAVLILGAIIIGKANVPRE